MDWPNKPTQVSWTRWWRPWQWLHSLALQIVKIQSESFGQLVTHIGPLVRHPWKWPSNRTWLNWLDSHFYFKNFLTRVNAAELLRDHHEHGQRESPTQLGTKHVLHCHLGLGTSGNGFIVDLGQFCTDLNRANWQTIHSTTNTKTNIILIAQLLQVLFGLLFAATDNQIVFGRFRTKSEGAELHNDRHLNEGRTIFCEYSPFLQTMVKPKMSGQRWAVPSRNGRPRTSLQKWIYWKKKNFFTREQDRDCDKKLCEWAYGTP